LSLAHPLGDSVAESESKSLSFSQPVTQAVVVVQDIPVVAVVPEDRG
jgi:hypothetical protein